MRFFEKCEVKFEALQQYRGDNVIPQLPFVTVDPTALGPLSRTRPPGLSGMTTPQPGHDPDVANAALDCPRAKSTKLTAFMFDVDLCQAQAGPFYHANFLNKISYLACRIRSRERLELVSARFACVRRRHSQPGVIRNNSAGSSAHRRFRWTAVVAKKQKLATEV